jgi:RND family efflux transporter MFP subunit
MSQRMVLALVQWRRCRLAPERAGWRAGVLVGLLLLSSVGWAQNVDLGVTQAIREANLSLTASGRVEAIFVREGDEVDTGQLLMHLDKTLERLEWQRRTLALEDEARLQELHRRERLLTQQVAAARELLVTGSMSRKEFEDEEQVLSGVIAERRSLEAAKQRERVEQSLAEEAYARRHLHAPFAGVVTAIGAQLGESVAANETVLRLVDVTRVRFIASLQPARSDQLRVGDRVTVVLDAATPAEYLANVVFVSPVTDPASGLVEVIAEFDNPDRRVRPGVTGRFGH